MTPQEWAAELAEQISGAHHQLAYPGATVRSLVFDALQETRRAALRDVLSDLDSLHWKEHWYADQLRKKINDRLISEGA